ncbi:MAG: hypothetical protein A3I75_04585 [Deltaproteobacteria bacterium RIFCSPLOWO2_02_FULL_50_16]|nr:MAG: hypothetical protein A2053_06045 [Deltaproteobacteria bacterium GWA2_50_8]OGQ32188.1 MAG: hypothetical protein A3B79_00955 [Deltaproteobacteria bacterium RIFCSPHIGHO2_02_FULL_50_15]OGQ55653.1 MAG: hypothetical protein A3I75_04585 [Deltaproteobacteria bacterium RIFCSPLOWO2_02_FULL_50_16]OGQ68544.1 MAG: hypothetical protein A3F89_08400 [Deltaproteobacteria bacterium RIFCSPLOWO2_12_FULL_50_11]
MKDALCRIEWHETLGEDYFRLGFVHEVLDFQPGQFVMIQVPGEEVLLRRPFSLCQKKDRAWEIVYKAVGAGTRLLSNIPVGKGIKVFGPLGHPFSFPDKSDYCFVAGGYGIAPFLRFSQLLEGRGKRVDLFYGARTKKDLLLRKDFESLDVTVHYCTEDGSEGFCGVVTDLFEKSLQSRDPQDVYVASCGPTGLLQEVARLGKKYNFLCEVSIEASMACGSGVCLGCVVDNASHEKVRTCMEGPVFKAQDLSWE